MSMTFAFLCEWSSDAVLFPALQVGLAAFALFTMLRNWYAVMTAGRGRTSLQVTRGEASMSFFYGTYAATNGLLVAICLTTEVARNHRVLWAILDTVLVAYVCLFNPWFRNLLVGWAAKASKIEKR